MLNRIIDLTLTHRWLVLAAVLVLLAAGGYALYTIPVEAFPDLTNNQVVVVTDAPSLPPSEVEQLVTYPIERAMLGLPNKGEVRSLSKLGLSMVTVVFDDSVPMYFARQLVSERLQQISTLLPQGVQPSLGLPATAFGELYQYTISGPMNPMELKDLHEWVIKGQLRTIPGVSEINAWGGQTKQFQIVVDPALLEQYGLTLHDVATRVEENNTNFGGGYIEHASEQFTLIGSGRAVNTDDLGNIVLTAKNGTPVLVRDVAELRVGAAPPEGATLRNGETVSGMVNSHCREELIRGLCAGHSGSLSVPRQSSGCAHYGFDHSVLDAFQFFGYAAIWDQRQSDEPWSHRLRNDCGWSGGHDGEFGPPPGTERCGRDTDGVGAASGAGSCQAHDFRRDHHYRCLSTDFVPARFGRPHVPPHGYHCVRGSGGLAHSRPDHASKNTIGWQC